MRKITNIAMWSGPRNISTAMMRSFENRADCRVLDEPLYGYYLDATGIPHPGAQEVIDAQGTHWQQIIAHCRAPSIAPQQVYYQKHMTMHLLPSLPTDWLADMTNCLLIRRPAAVIRSYAKKRQDLTFEDLGFAQQWALFETIHRVTGKAPIIVDSDDVLRNPEATLTSLCHALSIDFDRAMLHWPQGPRDSDGVWSSYWYESVINSSGFSSPANTSDTADQLPAVYAEVLERAMPLYERLYAQRLTA